MTNTEIENLVNDVFKRLSGMAKRRFKDRVDDAKSDLLKFEATMKKDLLRYTEALSTGDLTESQYKELLGDNLRLLQMKNLTQAGTGLAEIDKFKSAAVKMIFKAVLKVVSTAV